LEESDQFKGHIKRNCIGQKNRWQFCMAKWRRSGYMAFNWKDSGNPGPSEKFLVLQLMLGERQ
jgi:hypothetical protein